MVGGATGKLRETSARGQGQDKSFRGHFLLGFTHGSYCLFIVCSNSTSGLSHRLNQSPHGEIFLNVSSEIQPEVFFLVS